MDLSLTFSRTSEVFTLAFLLRKTTSALDKSIKNKFLSNLPGTPIRELINEHQYVVSSPGMLIHV